MTRPSISFVPAAERQLPASGAAMEVLLAALVRGDQPAWPFTGMAAEQQFLEAAQRHGVVPLVAWQHRRCGSLDDWPAALRSAIVERARQHAIVEQLQRSELAAVVGELTTRSVRSIVLKGAALAYTHYPHPCLRPREDFDLLVHESRRNDAVDVLRARGYAPLEMITGELVTAQQTFGRHAGRGVRYTCDLHWRVSNRMAFSRLLPWDRLAAETRPIPALDACAEGLAPPHALLMACVHRVAHHFDPPTLIWLYDIHLLASSMSEEDAARFVALAVDSGLAAICARGLGLAQHHFRTTLPAAFDRLAPAADEPLAAYLDQAFRPFDALISDLRALGGNRARWQLLREHLFPQSSYVRAARPRMGSGPLPWLYARRIVRGVSHWFHAARES
jgi:Uncharacterised nucleotidyltransferase